MSRFYIYRLSPFYATNLASISLNTSRPKSLVLLSCAKVVSNDEFNDENSEKCTTHFPPNLYPELMKDALDLACLDCAKFLLSTWPSKMISLSEVSPPYDRQTSAKRLLRLFSLWLDVVRKGLTPCLRVLDLRGGILSDCTMKILFRRIFSLCNKEEPLLDDYHIIADCCFTKSIIFDDVMILLAMTDGKSRVIHLHFNNLWISQGLKKTKIWDLLQRINPKELSGLGMPCFTKRFLVKILTRFSSLTALSLTSAPNKMLPLHLLTRLRCLRLSLGWPSVIASWIPVSILSELEYLRTQKCPNDFQYLMTVPLRLQEVVLDGCEVLDSYLHLWREFFISLAPTLKVLQMRDCIEDTSHFPPIVSFILPLVNLVYLILCGNAMTFSAMLEHVPKLGAMPNLKRMALCSTYEEDELEIKYDAIEKRRWLEAIEEKTAKARIIPVEIEWDHFLQ